MGNPIKIAIDAMGGENSPEKVLKGIEIHNNSTDNILYNIFGDKSKIEPLLNNIKFKENNYKVIHTNNIIEDTDSPLSAAKKGKDTSMWLSVESLKKMSQMQLYLLAILVLYLLLQN